MRRRRHNSLLGALKVRFSDRLACPPEKRAQPPSLTQLGRNSMPILPMLCAILFAVGYLVSQEAQEAPNPQLSPGSARKPAPVSRLQTTPSSPQSVALSAPRATPLQVA
jgi:hypothetical protein